ncbi:hypothetical protein OVA24_08760 [Luteolibacter sp. SL250]|uniref:hypothetical protein n=1 Tax=Luteolibacter sp. SL250 TaxID=2995170 RepID=UPI002270DA9F|nr:hypothetical protein [Luteolibacter sp. SL250]WAC21476.1 hypothetical protein OVA24_08760 [Luteolibacter sp. SL250]
MAPISFRKLVAWHLLMVAALALCWMMPTLWIFPMAVVNLAPLMMRPQPERERRESSLVSSAAIVLTIAALGTFIIYLSDKDPDQGTRETVPPAYLWWFVLALAAMASWQLIRRWRNPGKSISGDPAPPGHSGRTYAYHCPACQQLDAVEAGSLIPEPKLPTWNCPACGQLIGPAQKHPVILILLHAIFLILYLMVTGMKLCPLWMSVTGAFISYGIIQYLFGGIRIVPITRRKDFIAEEME